MAVDQERPDEYYPNEDAGEPGAEFVSEAVGEEDEHFPGYRHQKDIPPVSCLNYINLLALPFNFFFPVAVYGFNLFGDSHRSPYNNAYLTSKPIVFEIMWIFVFVLQGIFVVVQMTPPFRSAPLVRYGTGSWYALATFLQTLWLVLLPFVNDWFSFAIFVIFWMSLGVLVTFQYHCPTSTGRSWLEYWLLKFPFEVYFAWMTITLISEMGIVLSVQSNVGATGMLTWGMITFALYYAGTTWLLFGLNRVLYVVPILNGLAIASIGGALVDPAEAVSRVYSSQVIVAVQQTSWILGSGMIVMTLLRALANVVGCCRGTSSRIKQLAGVNNETEVELSAGHAPGPHDDLI